MYTIGEYFSVLHLFLCEANHKFLLMTPTLTPHKGGSGTSLRGSLQQCPPAPSA